MLSDIQYNLKQLCPALLRLPGSKTCPSPLFDDNRNINTIEKAQVFSNYLSYFIFKSFLQREEIDLKQMEKYYTSNMMAYFKKTGEVSPANTGIFLHHWLNNTRVFKYLKDRVENWASHKYFYKFYYSDYEDNFEGEIPIVGINKDDSVSLLYFCQGAASGQLIDVIRIPSICRAACHFINNGILLHDITIIWLPLEYKKQRYAAVSYKPLPKFLDYLGRLSAKGKVHSYPNLGHCGECRVREMCDAKEGLFFHREFL